MVQQGGEERVHRGVVDVVIIIQHQDEGLLDAVQVVEHAARQDLQRRQVGRVQQGLGPMTSACRARSRTA